VPFDLNQFRQFGLPDGGARPSQFEVWLTPPAVSGTAIQKVRFQIMAASIPPAQVGVIEVPYFGRKTKVAGDRTFPDWNVNVINDEKFPLRAMFEKWSNDINTLESNLRLGTAIEQYKSTDAFVLQYGKQGDLVRSYRFIGIWPSDIGPIQLDWDRTNAIETFPVTLSYDYWTLDQQNGAAYQVDAAAIS
jgi:hypothetical protein